MPTPSAKVFVSYLRVSTQRQGQSGLGIAAQRQAIETHIESIGGSCLAEFVEVETGKGANALVRRPELGEAIKLARASRAVLLIAKLDRLARNVHFISGLIESGVDFTACDMPHANKLMLQIHAVMAEHERDQIAARTKAALNAAKQRGTALGTTAQRNAAAANASRRLEALRRADALRDVLTCCKARGESLRQMALSLNDAGYRPPDGGDWFPAQVARVLRNLSFV